MVILRAIAALLITLAASALAPRADACTIGISRAEATATNPEFQTYRHQGAVRFQISNRDCPFAAGGRLKISTGPYETTGTLKVVSWEENITNVTIPAAGQSSAEHVFEFTVQGQGSMHFQVSIDSCNSQRCDRMDWELINNVRTNTVTFP